MGTSSFLKSAILHLLTVGKRSIVLETIFKAAAINHVHKDKKLVEKRLLFRNLKAVQKGNVIYVDKKIFSART
ncbi:hypothetical protein [Desulfovulcanus sp.]